MRANLEVLCVSTNSALCSAIGFHADFSIAKNPKFRHRSESNPKRADASLRFAIHVDTPVNIQIPVTDEMASVEKFYDALILAGSILLLLSVTSLAAIAWFARWGA
jgi:hypothetical protein